MSCSAATAEKREVNASGLLLHMLCCAGVQPRLLSAICIHLAPETRRHDSRSFPDTRPATNTFSWYKISIPDGFPGITEKIIAIPAEKLGFTQIRLVPGKDAARRIFCPVLNIFTYLHLLGRNSLLFKILLLGRLFPNECIRPQNYPSGTAHVGCTH